MFIQIHSSTNICPKEEVYRNLLLEKIVKKKKKSFVTERQNTLKMYYLACLKAGSILNYFAYKYQLSQLENVKPREMPRNDWVINLV